MLIPVTLERLQIDTICIAADTPADAARIAVAHCQINRMHGWHVSSVNGEPCVMCHECDAVMFDGHAAIKDQCGRIFCSKCYQPEYDVVQPETEACDAVS